MLNLYQLQMFLAVVDSGSFSAAAEALHLTQPAVSEGVRALEQRLGGRLFERRGRRATVTPAGAALIEPARALLAQATLTEQEHLRRGGVLGGVLRLGIGCPAGAAVLAAQLGAFARRHPGVRSVLIPQDPAAVLEGLRAGELDGGVLAERPRGSRVQAAEIGADEWLLLAPPGHAWGAPPPDPAEPAASPAPPRRRRGRPPSAQRAPGTPLPIAAVAPADLHDQRLVLESTATPLGLLAQREVRDRLEERGVPWSSLRPVCEVLGTPALLRAVEAGAGVGLILRSAVEGYPGPARAFRLEERPLRCTLFAVRDTRIAVAPVGAAWWDFLTAAPASPA